MTQIIFNIGNQEITASCDNWEELFEKLKSKYNLSMEVKNG